MTSWACARPIVTRLGFAGHGVFLYAGLLADRGAAVDDGERPDHCTCPERDRAQGAECVGGHEGRETADLNIPVGVQQASAVELDRGQLPKHCR